MIGVVRGPAAPALPMGQVLFGIICGALFVTIGGVLLLSCSDPQGPPVHTPPPLSAPQPADIRIAFGHSVTGKPGDEVRVAVRVLDHDYEPMRNAPVRFEVAEDDGTLNPRATGLGYSEVAETTDGEGLALVRWRFGESEGTQELKAYVIRGNQASLGPAVFQARVTAEPELGTGFGTEQFAMIPAGSFDRGSEDGYYDERPVRTVTITRSFQMQKTPITQEQWTSVMGWNPSDFKDCGEACPVERVCWDEIMEFLEYLNTMYPDADFRLPTEAQWEYAARAGTTGDFGGTGNLDDMGWYRDNSDYKTHPVAGKEPNDWGLYDMHGNVWEWVQDWYGDLYYAVGSLEDPTGPATGNARVLRGGSWWHPATEARSANRFHMYPDDRNADFGFRLVRRP